jgi:hypothetical protein
MAGALLAPVRIELQECGFVKWFWFNASAPVTPVTWAGDTDNLRPMLSYTAVMQAAIANVFMCV